MEQKVLMLDGINGVIEFQKFYTLNKMVIKQEELNVSKFTIEEEDGGKGFKEAWFNYDERLPIIELEGMLKTYVNTFEGKRVYSLAVDIYKTDFNFRELEKKLSELAGESFSTIPESLS